MRFKTITKPERCPECDRAGIATIIYGLPFGAFSEEIEKGIKDGLYIYAGCCCGDVDWEPTWQCRECGAEIEKIDQ
jgi:hypothetical protein